MRLLPISMRSLLWPAAALLLVTVAAGPASAQTPTLGEVAKKEQERRKALPSAQKVYTNKDLPPAPPRPEGAPAAAPAEPSTAIPVEEPAAEGQKPEAAPAEPGTKPGGDEASWRKRMADAREELRRSELFAEALQTRVNSLNRDFLSRSDPVQKAKLGEERKEASAELARVRQEVEKARKQIAEIEEEARRAGVPPGWLR